MKLNYDEIGVRMDNLDKAIESAKTTYEEFFNSYRKLYYDTIVLSSHLALILSRLGGEIVLSKDEVVKIEGKKFRVDYIDAGDDSDEVTVKMTILGEEEADNVVD